MVGPLFQELAEPSTPAGEDPIPTERPGTGANHLATDNAVGQATRTSFYYSVFSSNEGPARFGHPATGVRCS